MMEQVLKLFFPTVVILFTIASTFLAGYSVQNKLRLRNIRTSWRAGTLAGYPLFATVFFGLILTLSTFVFFSGFAPRYGILSAYLWISSMWFISSYLASKYYLTDYGIVKNINEPSQTIPWFQVLDYVEKESAKGVCYIFTYSEMNKSLTKGYKKLELLVPESKKDEVKKIVSLKLENRFDNPVVPDIDLKRIQD